MMREGANRIGRGGPNAMALHGESGRKKRGKLNEN